jgi:serine protease AprX
LNNDMVEIIVECNIDDKFENIIGRFGNVKYNLPCINSYVVEIQKKHISNLKGIKGIKAVYQNTHITAQMNNARKIVNWEAAKEKGLNGKDITIAILDTGIAPIDDFTKPRNRIIGFKDFINNNSTAYDDNCHGTHVAGIAAGNGIKSNGRYCGIATESNLVGVKILDKAGKGNASKVLAGIQWIIDNKNKYNIRIANLSIGSPTTSSTDPLVKAVNAAWDNGIIMTIAAGNNGPKSSTITSPGISKKAITVGSSDDTKAVTIWGNSQENFSGRGPTFECIMKPDIIAPGADIISCLTPTPYKEQTTIEELKVIDDYYLKLSGTSMSTPIITGAIALLLQKHPHLTPDDVKYMLKFSTTDLGYPQNQQGWGLLDIRKLLSKEGHHVR